MRSHLFIPVLCLLIIYPCSALAQWQPGGIQVAGGSGHQSPEAIITASGGGYIIVWKDDHGIGGGQTDLYAQRFNAAGVAQWGPAGVVVCDAAGSQFGTKMISDGLDGAIVVWVDQRSVSTGWDIYVQRLNAAGVGQWTGNGLAVCTAAGTQNFPFLASDGLNGAIIAWSDGRSGVLNNNDVYAQRVVSFGFPIWTPDGAQVSIGVNSEAVGAVVPDGSNGAVVAWQQEDGAYPFDVNIYAQRVSSGLGTWSFGGVVVCGEPEEQLLAGAVEDGSGGAMVAYMGNNSFGSHRGVHIKRVTAVGDTVWTAQRLDNINHASHYLSNLALASDGAGGVLTAWTSTEYSGGGYTSLFLQRVDPTGARLWSSGGVLVTTNGGLSTSVPGGYVTTDGSGGAIVAFQRNQTASFYTDLYAQRLDATGATQWTAGGEPVSTAANYQIARGIAPDGSGGAVILWDDRRNGGYIDTWAGHMPLIPTAVGGATPAVSLTVSPNYPNPFSTTTEFTIRTQAAAVVTMDVFDVTGARVRTISVSAGEGAWETLAFDGKDAAGHALGSGVYFYRAHANGSLVTGRFVIAR